MKNNHLSNKIMPASNKNDRRFDLGKTATNIETVGLCILVFSLPALESPKWIGFSLYLLGIILRLWDTKFSKHRHQNSGSSISAKALSNLKGTISGFEKILLLMCAVAILSAIVNWPLPRGIAGLKGFFLCILMGFLIYRQPYDQKRMNWVIGSLFAGVLVGLSWSWWDYLTLQNPHLEFHSIPNLNRSVIYHAISIFIMLAVSFDGKCQFHRYFRIYAIFCLLVSLPSLIAMGSRGGLLGFMAGAGMLTLFSLKNKKVFISILVTIFFSIMILVGLTKVFDLKPVRDTSQRLLFYYKFMKEAKSINEIITGSDKDRIDYIRVSWAQITQTGHFFLGSGPSTYGDIDIDALSFSPPLYHYQVTWKEPTHAHNQYLTLWVEQGLIGVLCFLLLLGYSAFMLFLNRPKGKPFHYAWMAGGGALSVAIVAGLFNSVFTNEAGWLFMIVLGNSLRFKDFDITHSI